MSQIDVIIPCYNYAHFLRGCVQSVLGQEGVDVRVLIIDDCSPDETEKVGRQLAAEDARVEYRRHAVNQRHIATYNEGLLGWASAEYSLLLSADDWLLDGALKRAADLLDANPTMGMAYGRDVIYFEGDPLYSPETDNGTMLASGAPLLLPEFRGSPTGRTKVMQGPEFLDICCRQCDNPVPTPTAVVRTRVQKTAGGYDPALPHAGDMEMWMRFAAQGPVGFIDARQAYYRHHGRNMQNLYIGPGAIRDLEQRLGAARAAIEPRKNIIPGADRLLTMARRRVATEALNRAKPAFAEGQVDLSRQLMKFAAAADPGIKTTPTYRRMRIKHAVGPRAWATIVGSYNAVKRTKRKSAVA